jgi:hypothetical protein
MGVIGKFRAIILLAHQRQLTPETVSEITAVMHSMHEVQEQRNRIVHDAWYVEVGGGGTNQFRTMPFKSREIGPVEIDQKKVEETIDRIKRRQKSVWALRQKIRGGQNT